MGNWSYSYDNLNRLIGGSATSGPYSGHAASSWSYDPFGNRTSEVTPVSSAYVNYAPPNNQITGGLVQYDAAGNVTFDANSGNSYLYDGEGRLCAVLNAAVPSMPIMTGYFYDAAGTRVAKGSLSSFSCNFASNGFTPTTSYVLGLNGEQVTELTVSGAAGAYVSAWKHANVFDALGLQATYSQTGSAAAPTSTYFALNDWLGTKRAEVGSIVGSNGAPQPCVATFASLPYGDGLTPSGNCPDATEHHFTGKERDAESGNDYFGARYYASSMGRWMSPDTDFTLKRILPNPQKWNRYAYVLNNPLIMFDPDGLAEWYVFRPLIPAGSKLSPQWQRAVNAANKRGDNVHMMLGKDANVKNYEQALKTPGAYVEAITHASPGGISLSDGSSQGSYGSTSASMTQSGNSITATVNGTSDVQITAQEVAVIGCQSSSLDYQYSDTTFVGVDPGAGGGITTDLGSAIGASFLEAGGNQPGVDAGNQDIQSSQDPRNDGANVEITPPPTPPTKPNP